MRYLILAAGMGRRLGTASAGLPKCLIELNGETLIARLLRQIRRNDPAADIHVVLGFRSDAVMPAVDGCRVILNPRFDTTGINASIWFARGSFDRPLMLIHADLVLDSAVDQEACPLNLAPTASTTAQMALGDALAVALLDARGFREEDFARSHPGGALGRKLLTHVRDVMRKGESVPHVAPDTPFIDMMREMTKKGLGATAIADVNGHVLGIFTDGDLRRLLEQGMDLRGLSAREVMHPNPRLVHEDALAVDAADVMEQFRITSVLVVDAANTLVGALNSNDLMRAKVI